jgi:hypothetical protein
MRLATFGAQIRHIICKFFSSPSDQLHGALGPRLDSGHRYQDRVLANYREPPLSLTGN